MVDGVCKAGRRGFSMRARECHQLSSLEGQAYRRSDADVHRRQRTARDKTRCKQTTQRITLHYSTCTRYKQHEQSLQLGSRIVGGAAQVAYAPHGTVVVGASPVSVVCLTSTGMAAPVASLKGRWPRTARVLALMVVNGDGSRRTAQQTADLARVRGDGDVGAVVVGEDVVQNGFGALVLGGRGLGGVVRPVGVFLCEALFELEAGEVLVQVRLVAAAVTGVRADALAEELLDSRDEGGLLRQSQVGKGELCRVQAAVQRAGVV